MILIDAIYINNEGEKVLLEYLVTELEKTDFKIFYLFDDRIEIPYLINSSNTSVYQSSSFIKRLSFYISHWDNSYILDTFIFSLLPIIISKIESKSKNYV